MGVDGTSKERTMVKASGRADPAAATPAPRQTLSKSLAKRAKEMKDRAIKSWQAVKARSCEERARFLGRCVENPSAYAKFKLQAIPWDEAPPRTSDGPGEDEARPKRDDDAVLCVVANCTNPAVVGKHCRQCTGKARPRDLWCLKMIESFLDAFAPVRALRPSVGRDGRFGGDAIVPKAGNRTRAYCLLPDGKAAQSEGQFVFPPNSVFDPLPCALYGHEACGSSGSSDWRARLAVMHEAGHSVFYSFSCEPDRIHLYAPDNVAAE